MSKPWLSVADGLAYAKASGLPVGATVTLDGKRATFTGMTGYLITLKASGRIVYLRAGDPRIALLL